MYSDSPLIAKGGVKWPQLVMAPPWWYCVIPNPPTRAHCMVNTLDIRLLQLWVRVPEFLVRMTDRSRFCCTV